MAAAEEEGTTPFHVVHKVPAGDGLYVRAKHAQLVERKPEKAIALLWASLEAGDRVDSALKDLAIVLKQQNRPHDAIFAISTFRSRCSESAQDSLDNVLLDLYKSSGRLDDQIALLIHKLRGFQNSQSFNGKRTKTARSQGKKFQVSVEQEVARLLGNLGWAYMQQSNYKDAESVYRRALALEVDINKVCNLGVCLMKQGKAEEAITMLQGASFFNNKSASSDSYLKSYERAQELMRQASAMLMSNNAIDIQYKSTLLPSANLMDDELRSQYHCKRACDDRKGITVMLEANVRDTSAHVSMAKLEDAEEMSKKLGDAWVLACNNDEYDGVVRGRHECEDTQGSSDCSTQNVEEGSCSPLHASVRTVPMSNSLRKLQIHARRRLPVFQDITVLGSAAA